MTLTIELDPELVAVYTAEAARRGVHTESLALEILRAHQPVPQAPEKQLTVESFHKMLDELRAGSENLPILPPEAFERESFYEDDRIKY